MFGFHFVISYLITQSGKQFASSVEGQEYRKICAQITFRNWTMYWAQLSLMALSCVVMCDARFFPVHRHVSTDPDVTRNVVRQDSSIIFSGMKCKKNVLRIPWFHLVYSRNITPFFQPRVDEFCFVYDHGTFFSFNTSKIWSKFKWMYYVHTPSNKLLWVWIQLASILCLLLCLNSSRIPVFAK